MVGRSYGWLINLPASCGCKLTGKMVYLGPKVRQIYVSYVYYSDLLGVYILGRVSPTESDCVILL